MLLTYCKIKSVSIKDLRKRGLKGWDTNILFGNAFKFQKGDLIFTSKSVTYCENLLFDT